MSTDKEDTPALIHDLYKAAAKPTDLSVANGMFVVARVAQQRFIAIVTDVYQEEGDVDISILIPRLPSTEFKWPEETRTATVPLPNILCEVSLVETNNSFVLPAEELNKLYNMKIMKKKF